MERNLFYAHSAENPARWETVAEHLALVANRAADFAAPFGAAEEARAAGLLHDLGKYGDLFQRRLHGLESKIDHWSAGAWAALLKLGPLGRAVALAVHGHHVGLQLGDGNSLRALQPSHLAQHHPHGLRISDTDTGRLLRHLADDGLALPSLAESVFAPPPQALATAGMLGVRMLFSALVDADYLETEAHFDRAPDGSRRYRVAGPPLRPAAALSALDAHVRGLQARAVGERKRSPCGSGASPSFDPRVDGRDG